MATTRELKEELKIIAGEIADTKKPDYGRAEELWQELFPGARVPDFTSMSEVHEAMGYVASTKPAPGYTETTTSLPTITPTSPRINAVADMRKFILAFREGDRAVVDGYLLAEGNYYDPRRVRLTIQYYARNRFRDILQDEHHEHFQAVKCLAEGKFTAPEINNILRAIDFFIDHPKEIDHPKSTSQENPWYDNKFANSSDRIY